MIEVIGQFLLEIFISYPGAAIRWLAFSRKKRFKELIKEDSGKNEVFGVTLLIALGLVISFVFRMEA